MVKALEETLKRKINVSDEPELVGALGAALLALRRLEKIREDKKTAVIGEEARAAS
jgi:activator of 2-hydroxyglutaryl-CoA dehydratase